MFHTKQDVDRHVVAIFKNLNSESERNLKCYRIAKHYYAVDDYKSAIRYINRYLSENSNSAAAHKLLGECYLKLNMKVKALDAFKTSLEHDGGQKDLALKVCELLSDPEIPLDVSRATYWLERTESFHPKDPVIFKLKEHLLKYGTNGQKNSAELEKLILAEVTAHPTDVTVRIRLLKFFIEFKRYQVAYEHALELEDRQIFYNDLQWYNCLCDVVEEYEKSSENEIDRDLGFEFFIRKITFLERRADLSMQEFHIDSKLTVDCSSAVFALDQALHAASKLKVPESEKEFLNEFLRHMGAQLCFHMATLVLKRAKKEYGIWSKVTASASPLLFLACQNTTFVEDAWYNSWLDRNKYQMNVWNKAMALRLSQAGHILRTLARDKENQFLQKVSQFCGGKWRTRVYLDVFYNRKHQLATATSYFLNNSGFANVVLQLMTDEELVSFDELSQLAYPESLNHLVWLGLVSFKTDGQLSEQFRCNVLPDLQFSVDKLYNTGPETLNQLDVDAFLYASVLCAKSLTPNNTTSEKPSLLPVSISEDLCTPAQADWWSAVYKVYRNKGNENISEIRLKLRKGIETVRVLGLHGLHIRLIVLLAKLFQERASKEKNSDRAKSLEARSNLYWSMAITPLEKLEKNEEIRVVPNRLFDYRGKELTPNEVKNYLEDGRLFLACRLMKQGMHEQAIEKFSALKSSYATYYQGLIYKQMAMDVVNQRPESITSENRSQHVILLTRARDAFFLTLERLRNPGVDYDHPLNSQIHTHLEEIESQLARIDTDSSKNRNGDVETDESDAGPCPGYSDADNSVTAYNNSGFLNDSALSVTRRSFRTKQNNSRSESKPSLERIDAHLRHLVEANKNELKEIKGAIQKGLINEVKLVRNEIKDLRIVFYDMLSEFRKLNRNKNGVPFVKRDMEPLDCMHGDDPESMVQISQQYPNYQNYPGYHHIPTCQASTSVSFGTPVVPPVSNVLQHGNIPTSIMPNTFFSPQRPMAATDPLLFYQGLSYYTQGGPLSFADNQNLASYRNTAAQKPSFLPGNSATDIHTTTTVSPTKPPMTVPVSTPSEQLPPSSIGVGATSTQMKEFTPSTPAVTKSPSGQAHAFQIPMPPQANLVKSPSENLWTNLQTPTKDSLFSNSNTLITSSPTADGQANSSGSLNTSTRSNSSYIPSEPDPLPDFKPIIPLPDEVKIIPDEATETKLFESRAKLLMFVDKEWVERGVGIVKVLHNEKTQKVRILMRRDQVFKICANHFILPEIELKPFNKDERSLLWSAKDDSDGELVVRTFCIRFSTLDEAKDFQFAFDKGREIARESAAKKKQEKSVNLTPPSNKSDKWECPTCKNKYDSDVKECTACQGKAKEQQKSIFGGFTITSPAEFKISSPKTDTTSNVEATDKTKPNPFASFAFKMPTTTQPSTDTKSTLSESKPILTGNISFESLASSGAVGDGFKRSENFKGFEGKGSLVFGYLDKQKEAEKTKEKLDTSKGNEDEEEGVTHAGDFVPTAEFTPVIPLPDLIEVKTGEEEEIVLYKERSKLLRFVSETKEWKERGLGEMKVLLNEKSGKVRLLMRREQVLKVCCNHFLDENMKFEPMTRNEKAITWCAQDYSEGDLKTELLALKFGKAESMQAFKKVIEEYQSKMKNGRIIGTKVTEEPTSTTDKEAKPLSEIFKPTPGSWECGSCYLRNNADSTKCVSCETPKPGTGGSTEGKSEIKGLQFDPSLASKFSFGIPNMNICQPSAPVTTSASTPSIFGGFGSKTSSEPLKFTFGLPAADSVEKKTSEGSNIFGCLKPPSFVFSAGKIGGDSLNNSLKDNVTTKVGEDPSNEDLSIVYEAKVTEEDREKAMKLMLPPNFYLYRDAADCPGCVGCDKEGGETNEATAVAASEKPAETKLFGQAPWSSQSGSFGSFKFNWGNADSNFSFNFGNTISPFATKEKSNPNSESGDDMYEEQAEDEDENDEERYDEYYDNDEEDEEGAEELEEEGGEDEVEDEDEDEDEGEDEVQDEGCEDGEQEEGEYVEEEEDNESPSDTGENSIVSK
ncbi:UNVERIFIED_CONTAM: hypothetical protein PYX00_000995 [Menopon gallinae]|uniref:E3 SUMO-protein ligase RanBP2 n=1 Tax=Menopon gallinae TaxID=328185 RepID=A0AAW2IC04_9NEOP